MKALTDERWQEIRGYAGLADDAHVTDLMLQEVLQQHDHLAAQIKLLADYIMSERPDDPAWSLGEGACAMAVEIMKRETKEIRRIYEEAVSRELERDEIIKHCKLTDLDVQVILDGMP